MESETFFSFFSRSAECRNAIHRVNGRVTAQPTEWRGLSPASSVCLWSVSALHILCLRWIKLSSWWKTHIGVEGVVTSCFCLVFDFSAVVAEHGSRTVSGRRDGHLQSGDRCHRRIGDSAFTLCCLQPWQKTNRNARRTCGLPMQRKAFLPLR